MPENEIDVDRALRSIAEHLDDTSTPVTSSAAMARPWSVVGRRRRRRLFAAAGLAAAAVVGVVAAAVLDDGDDRREVDAVETPTTTTLDPTTTSSAPPEPAGTNTYRGTPFDSLPSAGIAIVEDDETLLLDVDGQVLGSVTGPMAQELGTGPGRTSVAISPGSVVEVSGPPPVDAPAGCEAGAGGGGIRVALCGGQDQVRTQVVTVDQLGATSVLQEAAAGSRGIGHWRRALPSPDGRWVLAQWSGECEVPVAFLLRTDGGAPQTVDGKPGLGEAVESVGVGWTPDGRAIVQYTSGLCGSGVAAPGTYLVDPSSGAQTLIRPEGAAGSAVYTWYRSINENDLERSFRRALDELGLDGCCGEPSHGSKSAAVGARWDGVDIPVGGVPLVAPAHVPFNDLVLHAETIDLAGVPATAGEADLGPFVAFTCGEVVWFVGGTGPGERASADAVRDLAAALLPHLYCTVGDPPRATGHGVP